MVLLGAIASYFTLWAAPGMVLLRMAGARCDTWLVAATAVIVTSLAFNVLLVLTLVLCGLMSPVVVRIWVVLSTVTAVMILTYRSHTQSPAAQGLSAGEAALTLTAGTALAAVSTAFWDDFGRIVIAWDGIMVWNRFALALTEGEFAPGAGLYPQGLASMGALVYMVTGLPEQSAWARHATFVFPILLVVATGAYFGPRRPVVAAVAMAAAAVSYLGLDNVSLQYATSFTSDAYLLAAMVAAFAVVRVWSTARAGDQWGGVADSRRWYWYVAMALGCILAANAKQNGLIAGLLPALSVLFFDRTPQRRRVVKAIAVGVPILVVCMVWYVYAASGGTTAYKGASLQHLLVDIHQGRGLLQRASHAWHEGAKVVPAWLLSMLLAGSVLALMKREGRYLACAFVPLALFYAFVNGYSGRNVTAPLAVALLAGPVGFQALFERLVGDRTAGVWRQVIVRGSVDLRLPQRAVVAALAFGSILACLIYNDRVESAIERLDVLYRRDLGTRYANDLLERHVVPRAKPGDVLATNYNVADRLPQLSRLSVRITPGYNPEALLKLASQVPDRQLFVFVYHHVLAPDAYRAFVSCLVRGGEYVVLVGSVEEPTRHVLLQRQGPAGAGRECISP